MTEMPPLKPSEKVAALVARLQASFGVSDGGVDGKEAEPVKYVIYARRSLEESSVKQECSIGDQIGECKTLADRLGLRWVDVIAEKKSAMVAEKRPLFRAMLDNIRSGKYGGIIAWAPDRLARNMKEAGEIIDMLDKGEIKDLSSPTGSSSRTSRPARCCSASRSSWRSSTLTSTRRTSPTPSTARPARASGRGAT